MAVPYRTSHVLTIPTSNWVTPQSFPPHPVLHLNRLTDQLDGRVLRDGGQSSAVTANATVWLPGWTPPPQFWTPNELFESWCVPQPVTGPSSVPYLAHPVQSYSDSGLPLATAVDFEDISRYPQNARIAVHYDALPATQGAVWFHFPVASRWHALAPTGVVRNLKGREAAVAYRGHAGEPYHFVVMSYDERGRVEALLRYTENLGFDAVYYSYNALNAITSIRAVDAYRQSTTWYSYDWNGRVDTVWAKLSAAGFGFGVTTPVYRQPEARPTQADIVYSYSRRGAVETMSYPQVATEVSYRYNARAWLDTLLAEKNGTTAFRQVVEYNALGRIMKQRSQQVGQPEVVSDYAYDYRGQLVNATETRNGVVVPQTWDYDMVGNRMQNLSLGAVPARSVYGYADAVGPNRLTSRRDSVRQNGVWSETGWYSYGYNANGAMTARTRTANGSTTSEVFVYDGIQGVVQKYVRTTSAGMEDWRYRYSASGEREQKRLYSTVQLAAKEWRYYLLDGAKRQLAVYDGIETQQTGCSTTLEPRVYLWASEYLHYGQGSAHNLSIRPTGAFTSRKEYKVQDMLGSTRVVIEENGMGGVMTGATDYDAYGSVVWQSGIPQRKGWIDKEEDGENGLGDFGVRKYDSEIGRFSSIDPLWEEYRAWSPYHYCENNPLIMKDPSGKAGGIVVEHTPALDRESTSGHTTSRSARSADDPPRGSSHLEESFKSSLEDCANMPGAIGEMAYNMGNGITSLYTSYMMAQYEAERFEANMAIEAVPDAMQVTVGASGVAGVGASGSTGVLLLTRGPDAGLHSVSTGGVGGGIDIGFNVGVSIGNFTGSTANMKLSTVDGIGVGNSLSANILGRFSLNNSFAQADSGNWVFGGAAFGVSLPTLVGGSTQTTWTKTIQGITVD